MAINYALGISTVQDNPFIITETLLRRDSRKRKSLLKERGGGGSSLFVNIKFVLFGVDTSSITNFPLFFLLFGCLSHSYSPKRSRERETSNCHLYTYCKRFRPETFVLSFDKHGYLKVPYTVGRDVVCVKIILPCTR